MPSADRRSRDPAEKAASQVLAQLAKTNRISDLQWLMGDVRGRRYVWCLLQDAGIYQTTWTGEALSLAFNEGKRNSGLALLNELLQHCPKRFSEMQRENQRHESNTEGEQGPANPPQQPAG